MISATLTLLELNYGVYTMISIRNSLQVRMVLRRRLMAGIFNLMFVVEI